MPGGCRVDIRWGMEENKPMKFIKYVQFRGRHISALDKLDPWAFTKSYKSHKPPFKGKVSETDLLIENNNRVI
jgi:hypothetical protein